MHGSDEIWEDNINMEVKIGCEDVD